MLLNYTNQINTLQTARIALLSYSDKHALYRNTFTASYVLYPFIKHPQPMKMF